jgi:hypothetical protein
MSVYLQEISEALPGAYKAIYDKTADAYIVLDREKKTEVMRRPSRVVGSWRRGQKGAVMASALRHELWRRRKAERKERG